jgi:hypothetical protein
MAQNRHAIATVIAAVNMSSPMASSKSASRVITSTPNLPIQDYVGSPIGIPNASTIHAQNRIPASAPHFPAVLRDLSTPATLNSPMRSTNSIARLTLASDRLNSICFAHSLGGKRHGYDRGLCG